MGFLLETPARKIWRIRPLEKGHAIFFKSANLPAVTCVFLGAVLWDTAATETAPPSPAAATTIAASFCRGQPEQPHSLERLHFLQPLLPRPDLAPSPPRSSSLSILIFGSVSCQDMFSTLPTGLPFPCSIVERQKCSHSAFSVVEFGRGVGHKQARVRVIHPSPRSLT